MGTNIKVGMLTIDVGGLTIDVGGLTVYVGETYNDGNQCLNQ